MHVCQDISMYMQVYVCICIYEHVCMRESHIPQKCLVNSQPYRQNGRGDHLLSGRRVFETSQCQRRFAKNSAPFSCLITEVGFPPVAGCPCFCYVKKKYIYTHIHTYKYVYIHIIANTYIYFSFLTSICMYLHVSIRI